MNRVIGACGCMAILLMQSAIAAAAPPTLPDGRRRLELDEALELSKKTGRPMLVAAGQET